MRLEVSFAGLHAKVQQMGAQKREFALDLHHTNIDPIDQALIKGLEVDLKDVESSNGLLSYKGRQVLLYIQDHGGRVSEVLSGEATGNKYHVSDCKTLEQMRRINRFERYVVTNDLTSKFFISGKNWHTNQEVDGFAELKVCKNCLSKLNYQGYGSGAGSTKVFESFDLEEFFSTYSSYFTYMPLQYAGINAKNNYTSDWPVIAGKYKASKNYRCEETECGLDFSNHKNLLHVHHRNGVKTNNSLSNLEALCVECHRKQPCHGHMFVSAEDRITINALRRQQGGFPGSGWFKIIDLADPALNGFLHLCKKYNVKTPELYYEIKSGNGTIVANLDIAWPSKKIGVTVNDMSITRSKTEGWAVWDAIQAVENFYNIKARL